MFQKMVEMRSTLLYLYRMYEMKGVTLHWLIALVQLGLGLGLGFGFLYN